MDGARRYSMKSADTMAANAVNRVEFSVDPELDDPFKQLAASVILQAILDDLAIGQKTIRSDVFQFYADCCGIESDYGTLKDLVRERIDRFSKHHQRSATAWLDVSIKSGSD